MTRSVPKKRFRLLYTSVLLFLFKKIHVFLDFKAILSRSEGNSFLQCFSWAYLDRFSFHKYIVFVIYYKFSKQKI